MTATCHRSRILPYPSSFFHRDKPLTPKKSAFQPKTERPALPPPVRHEAPIVSLLNCHNGSGFIVIPVLIQLFLLFPCLLNLCQPFQLPFINSVQFRRSVYDF